MSTLDPRIVANRENAKKSTGPKTAEGKARSRANAFKHGLAGEGVAWPGEEAGSMEAFVAEQVELDRPQDAREAWLARRAAVSAWQVERGESLETLNAHLLAAGALDAELERRAAEVESLVALLPESPARAVRRLLRTVEGCEWVLASLWEMADAVDSGRPCPDSARLDALCRPPVPGLLLPSRAGLLALELAFEGDDPARRSELSSILLRRISEVEALLASHRQRPDPALEYAALAAAFDHSPSGERLRRYGRANLRQREKSLQELAAWREEREERETLPVNRDLISPSPSEPAPPPGPAPSGRPDADVNTLPGKDVATDWVRSAPGPDRPVEDPSARIHARPTGPDIGPKPNGDGRSGTA